MSDDEQAAILVLRRVKHILSRARTVRPGDELTRYLQAIVKAEDAIDEFMAALEVGDETE